MKPVLIAFLIIFIPIFSFSQNEKLKHNLLDGEYIVQLNPTADGNLIFNKEFKSRSNSQISVTHIMSQPLNLWLLKNVEDGHQEIISSLRSNQQVKSISQNKTISYRTNPNDSLYSKQWQYNNIGANGGVAGADMDMDLAWDIAKGGLTPSGDTIVICVIDDGINNQHEDIKGNLWYNHHEIPNNDIDDDNNGYVDDFQGWNVGTDDDDVYSGGGHGTPVSGIIGAVGNNKIGVSGVNWKVKIMMVNYNSPTEANALSAYGYAYSMRKLYNETNGKKGAFIVATNASWGIDNGKAEDAPLWCAMYDALGSIGVLNCGATANANTDVDVDGDLPTSCESEFLISVTNLNRSDAKVVSAGYGRKSIDIGAYGDQAFTVSRTGYSGFGGTSGATPHVTGMVGLLYSIPCIKFDSIYHNDPSGAALIAKDMILHGVSVLPALNSITTTGGKLNAYKSASNLQSMCSTCTPPSGISVDADDEQLTVSWISGSEPNIPVRFRAADNNQWINISQFKNGDAIKDLLHCTQYEVQVGSSCGFLPGAYSYSKFVNTSGCCVAPKIVSIQNNTNAIDLTWSSPIEAMYKLEYKKVDSPMWIDTLLTDNHFTLSHLDICQAYQFRLQSNCLKYEEISPLTNIITESTSCGKCTELDYCTFPYIDSGDEWIDTFAIGDLKSISGKSQNGYQNFAGQSLVKLKPGNVYPFSIKASYSGQAYKDYYRLLIDLNQNGIWEAEEQLFKTIEPVLHGVDSNISIPNNVQIGITKMRIIISYENFEGGCGSADFEYGEIEDYCLVIDTTGNCRNLTDLFGQVEKTKIKFIQNNTSDYRPRIRVDLRPFGSNAWSSAEGKDSIVFDGLKECTLFEYRYFTYCEDEVSEPSVIDTIKTSCKNSVSDFNLKVLLSPNPTSGILNLEFAKWTAWSGTLGLYDIQGKLMFSDWINTSSPYKIDITDFKPGIYILKLKDFGKKEGIFKIVKI